MRLVDEDFSIKANYKLDFTPFERVKQALREVTGDLRLADTRTNQLSDRGFLNTHFFMHLKSLCVLHPSSSLSITSTDVFE